jgi:transcriptional regulator with XRE-family HTH domain
MDDIYVLTDGAIMSKIGSHLKGVRLKQNITQQSLAESSGVSLSSLKKIEKGEIGSFDSLVRVLRTLGKLDVLQPLVDEEQLSPSEYYELVQSNAAKPLRKRAAGRIINNTTNGEQEW